MEQTVVGGKRGDVAQDMLLVSDESMAQLTNAQADQRRKRKHEQHERACAYDEPSGEPLHDHGSIIS